MLCFEFKRISKLRTFCRILILISIAHAALYAVEEDSWPKLVPSGDGFQAPPGFKTEVIATDPVVNNPAAMAVAPDGRIFVCEEYIHAHVKGKTHGVVTVLVGPEKGEKATRAITLAENLGSVQGMAFYDGKLYIAHTPYISVLPVSADNTPGALTNLITGIGIPSAYKAAHCVSGLRVHGGKLYIVFGDQGCDLNTKEGKHIFLDCGGILRCDMDGSNLEIFAHGFRNIYGIDFDENENAFVRDNTNDGAGYNLRTYHVVKGAFYGWPFRWKESDSKTPPVDVLTMAHDRGGGSPTGCMYLNSPAFPEPYNKSFLFCEWGNGLMVHSRPVPNGATYTIPEHPFITQPKVAKAPYTFRPCAAELAPDQSIVIADWGSAGLYPTEGKGRILRVTYTGEKPTPTKPSEVERIDISRASIALIVSDAVNKDPMVRAKAAYVLGEFKFFSGIAAITKLLSDDHPFVRLRAAGALGDMKEPKLLPVFIKALATEKERWVRQLLVRGIRECGDFSALLNNIESTPPDIQVDLLYACREIYDRKIADALLYLSKDAKRKELRAKATEFLGLIARKEAERWKWADKPGFTQPVRTVEWEASAGIMERLHMLIRDPEPLVRNAALAALDKLKDATVVAEVLDGIANGKNTMDDDTAYILVHSIGNEKALPALAKYATDPKCGEDTCREIVRALSISKAPEALDALRAVAFAERSSPALVGEAIEGLGKKKDKPSVEKILAVLKNGQPEAQRSAALALGVLGDASSLDAVDAAADSTDRTLKANALIALWRLDSSLHLDRFLKKLMALPASEDALQTDVAAAIYGGKKAKTEPALLHWLAHGSVGKETLAEALKHLKTSTKAAFAAPESGKEKFTASLEKYRAEHYPDWKPPAATAAKNEEDGDARLVRLTEAALAAPGDPAKGAAIFSNKRGANCIGCHSVAGVGAHVGPELTEVGKKYPRPYLIESVLYPSKQLLDGYEMTLLVLKNGERLAGIVQHEDKERLSVAKSDGSVETLLVDDVQSRKKSTKSLMPDGLVNAMTDQEFFDLIAYLESLKKQP